MLNQMRLKVWISKLWPWVNKLECRQEWYFKQACSFAIPSNLHIFNIPMVQNILHLKRGLWLLKMISLESSALLPEHVKIIISGPNQESPSLDGTFYCASPPTRITRSLLWFSWSVCLSPNSYSTRGHHYLPLDHEYLVEKFSNFSAQCLTHKVRMKNISQLQYTIPALFTSTTILRDSSLIGNTLYKCVSKITYVHNYSM